MRQTRYYELQLQREAEALRDAGFDVELIHMRQDGSPSHEVVNGVEVSTLPGSMGRSSKLRYMFDYARFLLLVSGTLTARHVRRPYAVIQVNTMPDFLVFSTALPKLFGAASSPTCTSRARSSPRAFSGPAESAGPSRGVEQSVLRFADHSIAVTDQLKERYVERGAKPEGITVVLNGADPESLLGDWSPAEADVDETVFTVDLPRLDRGSLWAGHDRRGGEDPRAGAA